MANDLTGQNIQDSYKRVLTVGDDGLMYDGTGSLYTPLSASHEITTELSSSHAISADTASFATNFTASGNISASGDIYGTSFYGGGGRLYANYNLSNAHFLRTTTVNNPILSAAGGFNVEGHLTASGDISSSGTIIADSVQADTGSFHVLKGDTTAATGLSVAGYIEATNITASGHISSSGTIIANEANIIGHITASGDISSSGNLYGAVVATPRIQHIDNSSDVYFATGINVAGGNHITASGNISSSGNIYSDELYTNGTNLKLYGSTNYQVISSSKQIVYNSVSHHFHPGNFSLPTGNDVFMKIGGDTNIIGNITASGNISSSGLIVHGDIKGIGEGKFYPDFNLSSTHFIRKTTLTNPIVSANGGFHTNGHITASGNISASSTIVALNLSGTNTGDQDLSTYIQNSQTSSFVLTSQSSSFLTAASTSSLITATQTSSFVLNSSTSSFITNTDTGSFSNVIITGSGTTNITLNTTGHITASGNVSASGTVIGSNTIRVANTKRFQGAQISTTNAGDWLHSDNEGEQKDDNYDNTIGTTGITSGTTTITTNIAARGSKYIVPTATTASKWTGYITHTNALDLSLGLWKVTPVDNNASALTLHEITGEITLEGKGNNKMRTFSVDVHPDSGSLSPGDLIVPLIKRESGTSSGVAHFNSSLLFYMEV